MLRFAFLIVLCSSFFLSACRTGAPAGGALIETANGSDEPIAVVPTPTVVEEIYDEIEATVEIYREGTVLITGGSVELGQAMIDESQAGLDDLINRCRAVAGCDLLNALTAYQQIVGLQSEMFRDVPEGEQAPAIDLEAADSMAPMVASVPPGSRVLNGQDLDSLIPDNRHVNEALNDWLTWRRPLLMSSYENYQYLRDAMAPAFEQAGLPEALLFGIVAVESGGKVHAYSRVGAAGPLQFMRATGNRYGLRSSGDFDERMAPQKAANAAVVYLNDQMNRLDNSLEKVLAAYNSGENRVARLNRRLKGQDFWTSEFFYALPRDTRSYVPDVMAAAKLYLHPEEYGLQFPSYQTDQTLLTLSTEASLGELAICLGNEGQANGWFRTLRNLNPQIKAGQRVKAGETLVVPAQLTERYATQCDDTAKQAMLAKLHDAAYNGTDEFVTYRVKSGDTMSHIARRFRCMSLREIAAVNNIPPPRYPLRSGKTIKVPSC